MNPVPSSGAPRIYLMPFRGAVAAVSAAVAATPLFMMLTDPGWTERQHIVTVYLFCAAALVVTLSGLNFLAETFRYRFVLATDYIEQHGIFKIRRVEFSQIAGFRQAEQAAFDLVLQLRDGSSVRLTRWFRTDPVLQAWLDRLQDLEYAEHLERVREVEENALMGATPAERRANNARSWKVVSYLGYVAFGVAILGYFYPRPYALVIGLAMALPLAALVIRWRHPQLYTLRYDALDPRATLIIVFGIPTLFLADRAIRDFHLVSWFWLVIPALVGGALVIACAGLKKERSWPTVLTAAAMAVYPAACAVFINTGFDNLPAASSAMTVADKAQASGRNGDRFLWLAAADDAPPLRYTVNKADYARFKTGDPACVVQHPGRLGIAWITIETCPTSPAKNTP